MKNLFGTFLLILVFVFSCLAAPSVDGLLNRQVLSAPFGYTPVVITFDKKPTNSDFLMLKSLGITGGQFTKELPIVLTSINKAQFNALKQKSNIRSLYANHTFKLLDTPSNEIIGVNNLLRDSELNSFNGGLPVTGKNIGVAYVDTGIDATHPDLKLGENVVQNVIFPTSIPPASLPAGFVPVLPVENQPFSDVEGGHGTFGAGVLAGTGAASAGFYRGVAPGAKLIGLQAGNDAGLTTYAIVQALDYALVYQFQYNIRVCNNSYGTTLADYPYDPNDPINTATRIMHDRNITVVFAAGNDGEGVDKINPFSVAPWVISVAAGEKQGLGTPAGFSSRGNDNGTGTDTPGQPADETALPNLRPDITGSGVDMKSARSKGPGVTNFAGTIPVFVGANDLSTISPAFLPFYTTSQGTSFSTPQVSGVVALMLEANPLLTPDQIVTTLRQTANPMPYEERVVGAGYVDAHNAVRAAKSLTAVAHPANLFPSNDPNAPQIDDASDDQLGTTAQDIRAGKFVYDAAANQIVYTLTLADLSVKTPNMRWTMTSTFGATEIFVTASIDETANTYEYGRFTVLATGTRNQETIGAADSGVVSGNQIIIRLSVDKINAAVAAEIRGTTSTNTQAQSQILVGSSLSGGLLLNSDSASGSDFTIANQPDPNPTPTPTPDATPTPQPSPTPEQNQGRFEERYSGTINPGQPEVEFSFSVRNSTLDAQINQNHGNQPLTFDLLDADRNLIATAVKNKIALGNLRNGTYYYRVRGSVSSAVDFTIKSGQGK